MQKLQKELNEKYIHQNVDMCKEGTKNSSNNSHEDWREDCNDVYSNLEWKPIKLHTILKLEC